MSESGILYFLPAKAGDCLLLELERGQCILIDCGYSSTYDQELKPLLLRLRERGCRIALMIVTHIDQDHIEGAIRFLHDNGPASAPRVIPVDQIWFNGFFNTLFRQPMLYARRAASLRPELLACREEKLKELLLQLPGDPGEISAAHACSFEMLCAQYCYSVNACFPDQVAKCPEHERSKYSVAGGTVSILNPVTARLDALAKKLDQEMKRWFGLNYQLLEDEGFSVLFETLMKLYQDWQDYGDGEPVSAGGVTLESWLNTSALAPMSEVNRASIVVEITYQGRRMLFAGDGESKDWVQRLTPQYDLIKLSHHGTAKPNLALLDACTAERMLISTDGGKRGRHPEDELLARAILNGKCRSLYFNYDILRKPQLLGMKERYGFSVHFGERMIPL